MLQQKLVSSLMPILLNCLLIKVGSFLLPITGEMGARYKKFSPMANQFYKFLHVLYSIIEG